MHETLVHYFICILRMHLIILQSHAMHAIRNWTNIPLPDDFKNGYEPKDSNDVMDPGRKVQKITIQHSE